MARSQYGPVVIAMPGATAGSLAVETAPLVASRTQGGTAETDLTTTTGTPISAPDPDDVTGAATWFGPDGYTGSMWVKDPATNVWWEVLPAGIANRTGGVSSIAVNGGTAQTGTVALTVTADTISDATTTGKGVLRASTQTAARTAIGAISAADIPAAPTFQNIAGLNDDNAVEGDNVLVKQSNGAFIVQPPQPDQRPNILQLVEGDPLPVNTPGGTLVVRTSPPAINFGFGTSLGGAGGGATQSVVLTMTKPVVAGTLIVVAAGCTGEGSTDAVWTVSDTRSNAYTLVSQTRAAATVQSAMLRCRLTTSLQVGDTITVDCGTVRNHLGFTAATAQNTAVNGLDKTAIAASGPSVLSLVVGPTAVTTQTDEIDFATFIFASNATTFSPTNGWIQAGAMQETTTSTSRKGIVLLYRLQTTTGTATASGDLSAAQAYAGVLGTWKKNLS